MEHLLPHQAVLKATHARSDGVLRTAPHESTFTTLRYKAQASSVTCLSYTVQNEKNRHLNPDTPAIGFLTIS